MSDTSVQFEYNQNLKPLEDLLSGVERAGSFVTAGSLEPALPRIDVEGVGILSFPVPEQQVSNLIEKAERAPYGRGEETILDTTIRKVWQVSPDKVHIGGKSWADTFSGILKRVTDGLACSDASVEAELYKLLIYDEGGFFLPHRDTEKTGGMFGTLVISLPCPHSGGELIARHAGREESVDLSTGEVSELKYVAFYADCEHEVKPITSGNRICLVYNLVHRGKSEAPNTPDYGRESERATELIQNTFRGSARPAKIAWLLDHQYSPAGLSFAGLKGKDAARAGVLVQAARAANCAVHLGIVHIEEYGPAEPAYYGGYGHAHDEEEGDEDFEVIEVSDGQRYIDGFRKPTDEVADYGRLPLADGELLPAGALDDEKPDEQRLLEASGNEGCSFERAYHRAALVIWPAKHFGEVLLQAGAGAALPYLADRLDANDQKIAASLAVKIIENWPRGPGYFGGSYGHTEQKADRAEMLQQLRRLGDAKLWQRFGSEIVALEYDGSENAELVNGLALTTPARARPLICEIVQSNLPHYFSSCIGLLELLVAKYAIVSKGRWSVMLKAVAQTVVEGLSTIGGSTSNADGGYYGGSRSNSEGVEPESVVRLFKVLSSLESDELRKRTEKALNKHPEVFNPADLIVPALTKLVVDDASSGDAPLLRLWRSAAEYVLDRSEQSPEPPPDWRQPVKLNCRCKDCRELESFANDPDQRQQRLPLNKERRMHLHQKIDHLKLDMTHETERRGRPYTLVCTKTRWTFERQCRRYLDDIKCFQSLVGIAPNQEESALRERMENAIARRATARLAAD